MGVLKDTIFLYYYVQEQIMDLFQIRMVYYGKNEGADSDLVLEKLMLSNKRLGFEINYLVTIKRSF